MELHLRLQSICRCPYDGGESRIPNIEYLLRQGRLMVMVDSERFCYSILKYVIQTNVHEHLANVLCERSESPRAYRVTASVASHRERSRRLPGAARSVCGSRTKYGLHRRSKSTIPNQAMSDKFHSCLYQSTEVSKHTIAFSGLYTEPRDGTGSSSRPVVCLKYGTGSRPIPPREVTGPIHESSINSVMSRPVSLPLRPVPFHSVNI